MDLLETHVAVVGAGAAGLYTAVCAAREGADVTLISATPLAESSTYWAQGGLAAALAADDSPDRHLEDTIVAGRGAVRESAAWVLCQEARGAVEDLMALGVRFDADRRGRLALGLEGGHSARRIVHAGGAATGRRLIRQLSAIVAEDERIDVLEGRRATGLLMADERCVGVVLKDSTRVASAATVLATGGAAALWSRTTNPVGAIGGGLLLAHGAGAALADLELVQFHPTAVVGDDSGAALNGAAGGRERGGAAGADGFLVTEAVRGEGARLLDPAGQRFVDELAPRDEVARAVGRQLALTGSSSVSLDMRDVDPALFPNVVEALKRAGIDPEHELIPVAPAAHYMMGGIATDLQAHATKRGLYAVGECSCTGIHGANRLASNSLTECFVFGSRAARSTTGEPRPDRGTLADALPVGRKPPPLTEESRQTLWRHAGLERDGDGLRLLAGDPYPLVQMVARSALAREESRGAHQRRDFPALNPELDGLHVVVRPGGEPGLEEWV